MSILHTFTSREEIDDISSYDELQKKASIEEVKRYLRAEFISKESHQRYNLKRNKLLARALQLEAEGKL